MTGMKGSRRFVAIALAALFAVTGLTMAPKPAKAWFGFGWGGYPCCGYPYPYAPYPYPPAYYPPPPPPAYYPPTAYAAPPAAPAAPAAAAAQPAAITYTSKPAFKNATGQTCREFKTASNTFGTACQDASGQWRVSN
jgi:hypothetical protein